MKKGKFYEKESNLRIYETVDYEQFVHLLGQRGVKPNWVKSLLGSMCRHEYMRTEPIVVNEQREVINGQHRLSALKLFHEKHNRRLLFTYIIDNAFDNTNAMAKDKQNQHSWVNKNFEERYIALGIENYKISKDFRLMHEFRKPNNGRKFLMPIGIVIKLLGMLPDSERQIKEYQDGKLKIFDIKASNYLAGKLIEIGQYFDSPTHSQFVQAIISLWNSGRFDLNLFVKQLSKGRKLFEKCGTKKQYIRSIQDVYNHGIQRQNRQRFNEED